MPGSQDYVYDLKSYMNSLNKDFFLFVADIPKYKNIKDLRVNAGAFSSIYKRRDMKFLLKVLSRVINDLDKIQCDCFDDKTLKLCSKLKEQKFNFLLFSFVSDGGAIIELDSLYCHTNNKKSAKVLASLLAGEAKTIFEQYKY